MSTGDNSIAFKVFHFPPSNAQRGITWQYIHCHRVCQAPQYPYSAKKSESLVLWFVALYTHIQMCILLGAHTLRRSYPSMLINCGVCNDISTTQFSFPMTVLKSVLAHY